MHSTGHVHEVIDLRGKSVDGEAKCQNNGNR